MKKIDGKNNLLEHSEAKVKLLGEYIRRYLNVISHDGYTETIKIYDVFCGLGLYENGGEGSPLVIMRAVKELYFSNKAKSLKTPIIDFYFNDNNQQRVENVQRAIKEKSLFYEDIGSVRSSVKEYQEVLSIVQSEVSTLKKEKAFVFIDPYGYKDIKPQDIKALLRGGKTEVLLFSPIQFMYRFDENGRPEALQKFIAELEKEKPWKKTDSVTSFIGQLKDGLMAYLGPEYYVDTFRIKKDPQTVFCLFFFSSHIRGFEKMLEAKWEIDKEAGIGWTPYGTGLFEQIKTNPLADLLVSYLQEDKRHNGDLYMFTLKQGFLPKHTTEILNVWQQDGRLQVIGKDNLPARKGAFYVSYENYKSDYKKVSYKLY